MSEETKPAAPAGEREQTAPPSETREEFAWFDPNGIGQFAVFAGNIFCGYEPTEEKAQIKVDALNEAVEEYAREVWQAARASAHEETK